MLRSNGMPMLCYHSVGSALLMDISCVNNCFLVDTWNHQVRLSFLWVNAVHEDFILSKLKNQYRTIFTKQKRDVTIPMYKTRNVELILLQHPSNKTYRYVAE